MQQQYLYNGSIKSISEWDVDSDRGWVVQGSTTLTGERLLFARVPWLYRGVNDRANNVAAMPYAIKRGETEVVASGDASDLPKDLAFLDGLQTHLNKGEQSLMMAGRAYWVLETNPAGYIKNLVYCAPDTITPKVYDPDGHITEYERTVVIPGKSTTRVMLKAENVLAVYQPDYLTESGPAATWPALAAVNAAGVLYNKDTFVSSYFKRGAIKATVLTVEGASPTEAERLKNWWGDVITGIKNAWTAIVLRVTSGTKGLTPTVIGEGLEGLQNTELTTEQRQDIATALGVPESRLWSAAANYATRKEDELAYYRGTIIPECNLIAEAFNTQVFTKVHKLEGYTLQFKPDTLDIFQEDEVDRSASMGTFIDFLTKCPTAKIAIETCKTYGVELTDDMVLAIKAWFAEKEAAPAIDPMQPIDEQGNLPPMDEVDETEPTPEDTQTALASWRRKAVASLKRGGPADVEFTTRNVPERMQTALHYELQVCKTIDEIKAAFDAIKPMVETTDKLTPLMARALAILEEAHAA